MTYELHQGMDPRFAAALRACDDLDLEIQREYRKATTTGRRAQGRSARCARSRHWWDRKDPCEGGRWDPETKVKADCLCQCHSEEDPYVH